MALKYEAPLPWHLKKPYRFLAVERPRMSNFANCLDFRIGSTVLHSISYHPLGVCELCSWWWVCYCDKLFLSKRPSSVLLRFVVLGCCWTVWRAAAACSFVRETLMSSFWCCPSSILFKRSSGKLLNNIDDPHSSTAATTLLSRSQWTARDWAVRISSNLFFIPVLLITSSWFLCVPLLIREKTVPGTTGVSPINHHFPVQCSYRQSELLLHDKECLFSWKEISRGGSSLSLQT